MKVLITGGTGFIGSRLALACRTAGEAVSVYGQQNTPAEAQNAQMLIAAGVELITGSVNDRRALEAAMVTTDVVYHLAAAQHEAGVSDQLFWDVNVTGTRCLLEAALTAGVKRVVHGSTIGVYGQGEEELDETSSCRPTNIYGVTKREGELLALSYNDRLPVAVVRISETYGPGDRRLLKLFKAIRKNAFFMIGPGKNLHQLIYIDDLVRGLRAVAASDAAIGEIILLAGPEAITTNEMVVAIADAQKAKIIPFRAPLWLFALAALGFEMLFKPLGKQPPLHRRRLDFFRTSFLFSAAKATRVLGFSAGYSFTAGVTETLRWYETQKLL